MTTSEERIVRYTRDELDEMARRGEDRTNWARIDAMTDEQLANSIDYEDEGLFDLTRVYIGPSFDPAAMDDRANWRESVYLEATVVDSFREQHPDDFRQHINDVLRAYIAEQERKAS